jgi:hypothetical protein
MNCIRNILVSVKCIFVLMIMLSTGALLRAQWENPVVDTITNTQVRKETTLQSLCLDDSGFVHLVWKHQVTGGWRIFYCTNSPAGLWGTPQGVGDSLQVAFEPAMAWSSIIGIPFVVYEQNSEIYAAYLSSGLWQAEPITANVQLDCSPTIAIDSWGLPHAAWITDDLGTGEYKIAYAASYMAGPYLGWIIQTLAGSDLGPYGTGASPFIAVTPEGIAHIVYRGGDYGNYHIHHAWNSAPTDTIWNYEILYSGNANDFSAAMVIEGDGDLHLAVSGNDGWGFPGRVYCFHKPLGQAWQQYELASLTSSAVEPSLSVDGNGMPHIVWMETSGNFYTGNIYYSGKDSTGAWQVMLVIGNDYFSPSFQIDQQGYGHVACHTGGNTSIYDIYHVKSSSVLTAVEEFENPIVGSGPAYILRSYPNPVRTHYEVFYYTRMPGRVTLKVYNSIGEEIATLVDKPESSGTHRVIWRPQGLSAGIYFLNLVTDRSEHTVKCVLLPQ